jgi:hypothetical protein
MPIHSSLPILTGAPDGRVLVDVAQDAGEPPPPGAILAVGDAVDRAAKGVGLEHGGALGCGKDAQRPMEGAARGQHGHRRGGPAEAARLNGWSVTCDKVMRFPPEGGRN